MNKLLHLFLLFFSFHSIHAQPFEWNVQQGQYTEINTAYSMGNGNWLLGGGYLDIYENTFRPYLRILNKDGTIWGVSGIGRHDNPFLYKKYQDHIFELGLLRAHDFHYITKNLLGDSTMVNVEPDFHVILGDNIFLYDMEVLPEEKVIVVGEKIENAELQIYFAEISNNLDSLHFIDQEEGFIHDIEIINDSTILVAGKFGIDQFHGIRLYNFNYEKIGEFVNGISVEKIKRTMDGNFFMAEKNKLYFMSPDFQIIETKDLSGFGEVVDIEDDESSIFVLTQDEATAPRIIEYSLDFQIINSFSYGDAYLRIKDLILSSDEIAIVGSVHPPFLLDDEIFGSASGFFKSFPRNNLNSISPSHDLEIANVHIPFFTKSNHCENFYNTNMVLINVPALSVNVVNQGEDTISSGTIFLHSESFPICKETSYNKERSIFKENKFFGLNLAPGDTATVNIQNLEFIQKEAKSYQLETCIWIAEGDKKLDVNPENNFFCGKIKLNGIDFSNSERFSGVFPNPANDLIDVSLKFTYQEDTYLRVFNSIGQIIQEWIIPVGNNRRLIDVSNFPNGTYIVRIENSIFKESTFFVKTSN